MKKLMMTVVLAAFSVVGFVGCADSCAKQAECAKKAGTSFSQTECTNDQKEAAERADSLNCGAEFNAVNACIAGLSCSEINSGVGILSECGAQYKKYSDCVN